MGDEPPRPAGRFGTTRWSLVADAASGQAAEARPALETLCEAYWYPLYIFLRRRGSRPDDARDLVQGFFGALLEKAWLTQADPERGRFRAWILASLRHYVANERAREAAQKRGGDRLHLSLDFDEGERRYRLEPATNEDAEATYDRRYAFTLLDRALERLAARYRSGTPDQAERYAALYPYLVGDPAPPYRETASRLDLTETAVKVAVRRLRGHFRDALRAEVTDTLTPDGDVDAEIQDLRAAVMRSWDSS